MISFLLTTIFSFCVYLLLTVGSGSVLWLWSKQELAVGFFFAVIVGFVARTFFCGGRYARAFNPLRWLTAVAYALGPFFVEMTKANVDVAYRVITGRIRPGIVRVKSGMSTDLSVLGLATSITLTPGTLTVGIDEQTNDLFIHWINVPPGLEKEPIIEAPRLFSYFDCPAWIRRIAE